tara:strand:+ start:335 stop:1660 length:1326 start_codon:yes stop_codon:yes gene_type:complete
MYSSIVKHIILPLTDYFLGLSISKELKTIQAVQWHSKEELKNLQLIKLKNILAHSGRNVPYYSEIFKNNGIQIEGNPLDEFKKIPFLTKKIIKNNLPDNILDNKRTIYTEEKTSGSSGHQGVYYLDKLAYSSVIAVQSLWWEWSGFRFGDKVLQTGMTLDRGFVKSLKDWLLRVNYTQAFSMDDKAIRENLLPFQRKTAYFMGYASSLYTYAQYAERKKIKNIKFESVVSWGDKMFPHYRKLIEKVFHTVVYDTYGAAEGLMIAAECEKHNYHIMTPHVLVEILDEDGQEVKEGEIGEIFVTSLTNYLMPLIRYKIGDLAVKARKDRVCSCGRKLPILEKIIGRDTDIIYSPKGKALIVHFFTGILEHMEEIKQFQVYQKSRGSKIEIKYRKSNGFDSAVLEKLKLDIYKKAEEEFPIIFTEVEKIPPSPSGKPQIIIRGY